MLNFGAATSVMRTLVWLGFLLLSFAQGRGAESLNLAQCRTVLGMQTGEIPDEALSASSSKAEDLGPTSARIRNEKQGGAWCPKEEVSKASFEYLQIDLVELKVITIIETQGHFGHGQGQEYTEQYMVNYQREDGGSWFRFKNRRGQELFQGNSNTYIAELRDVSPPIIAKRIRVIPYSTHPKHVCLRIELYGCIWTDGVVSYDMHQGERRGADLDLLDLTYDGILSSGYLSGGLGQLMDGDEGQSNFRLDPKNIGIRGYEWVGWKSDTFGDNPVEITFKFDCVRNFSVLHIFGNNLFSKDVRIFRAAKVFFALDSLQFVVPPIEHVYARDSVMEYARRVDIPLNNRIGRFVKVWLFFDSKWMLVSEVQFESEPIVSDASKEEEAAVAASAASSNSINRTKNISTVPLHVNEDKVKSVISAATGDDDALLPVSATDASNLYPDSDDNVPDDDDAVTSMSGNVETANTKQLNDRYIGIIIGVMSGLTFALLAILLIIFIRHRRYTCMPLPYPLPKVTKPVVTSYSPSPSATIGKPALPPDGDFQQEPIYDNIPSREPWTSSRKNSSSSIPSSAEVLPQLFMRELSGVCSPLSLEKEAVADPLVVASDQVALIERLGESRFGEVHLSEVLLGPRSDLSSGASSTLSSNNARSLLVIVRWLRGGADDQLRAEFSQELKTMLRLKHGNISQVVGLCTTDGPFSSCGVLMEAGEYGDLKTFLQQHIAEGGTTMRRDAKELSYGSLVYIASQIASGMKQMEVLNVVHRDLASRNCLIGPQYVIRVADLGRSYSRHRLDYCTLQDYVGLPIRWMSWEAVLLGQHSTKSDVWSFAVTLWEILTLARRWPLDGLTDKQVVESCNHYYMADGMEQCLDQPALCTREVYDLMIECCHRDEANRPSFKEIHMFLQRKNMGYRPGVGGGAELM